MTTRNPADAGPPINKSNAYVMQRIMSHCTECEECGEMTHYMGARQPGKAQQVNVCGVVMAARRAAYMATGMRVRNGYRVTSKCSNPDCINPALLMQTTPGAVIRLDYAKGNRSRLTAAAHLLKYRSLKLDRADVMRIMADERGGKAAAADYGISDVHFNSIKRGAAWKAVNPFAGLMA